MNQYLQLVITIAVGLIGWQIAKLLKVPAAAMIGSLFAVGAMSALFGIAYMPRWIKIFTQSIAGMFIGLQLRKEDLRKMLGLIKPILLLLLMYTVNTFVCGTIIHYIANIDFLSAYLSCIAGGLSDISMIAIDLNADLSTVVFMQSARLICTLSIFPYWIKKLTKNMEFDDEPEEQADDQAKASHGSWRIVLTIAIAFTGGLVSYLIDIPAGPIIFSMLLTAIINNIFHILESKRIVRTVAQVFSGSLVGSTITVAMLAQIKYLLLPIVLLISGYFLVNYLYSHICTKHHWLDYRTALFCSCPAGVSDIVLLSGDLGSNVKQTGVIHVTRLVYATALMPNIIVAICSLL